MKFLSKILVGLFTFVIIASTPFSVLAQSETSARDQVRFAHETEEQLLIMGCEKVLITNEQTLKSARSLGWHAVIPVDATEQAVVVCSPQIIQQLKPLQNGETQGLTAMDLAFPSISSGVSLFNTVNGWLGGTTEEVAVTTASTIATATSIVAPVLTVLFDTVAIVGKKFIDLLAMGLVPMFTIDYFIDAPVVQTLWPIMLGIANLGFLLALITIALLVTLRLDVGGGVRKLLPRLLLGAVLINFSLIIGGLILDISKLLTAIIASLFDVTSFDKDLFLAVYNGSGIVEIKDKVRDLNLLAWGWNGAAGSLAAAILTWVMVIALAVVLITLVIRYFALLVLLILSPFAYIALAFPGTQKIATAWWSHFLKYVAYGPIALLFLLAALATSKLLPQDTFVTTTIAPNGNIVPEPLGVMAYVILQVAIFTTGLILAATAGRYAGIVGSQTILRVASSTSKKARSLAYRGVRGTGKAAYVGTGARMGVRGIRNQAGDVRRGLGTGIRSRLPKWATPVKRDKDGKPLRGQPKTAGGSVGAWAGGGTLTKDKKKEVAAAQNFKPLPGTDPGQALRNSDALSPDKIRKDHVAGNLSKERREEIMRPGMGSTAQKVTLTGQVEAVRNMSDKEIKNILNLKVDLPTRTDNDTVNNANEKTNSMNRAIQKALHSSLNKIDKENI